MPARRNTNISQDQVYLTAKSRSLKEAAIKVHIENYASIKIVQTGITYSTEEEMKGNRMQDEIYEESFL